MRSSVEHVERNSSIFLAKAMSILKCFGKGKGNCYTLSELSRRGNMPKSSIHWILKTLSHLGYQRYEEHSKHYYLIVHVLSIGFTLLKGIKIRESARP